MRSLCLALILAATAPFSAHATPINKHPVSPPAQTPDPAPAVLGIQIGDHILIKPQLQYRPRFLTHGTKDFASGTVFDAFSHRARLGLMATMFKWTTGMIQLQDVRVWGEEVSTLTDYRADGFDVHQAWLEVSCPRGLSLRIGRQEFSLVNHRLIGTVGWADQARSFDGLLLGYRRDGLLLQGFYAKLGEKDVHVADPVSGKTIKGSQEGSDLALLHAHYTRFPWLRPSLSVIYDWIGVQNQNRITLGTFIDGKVKHGISYSGEFYFQTGNQEVRGAKKTISAMLAALKVGYTLPVRTAPGISFWFEYASGDDDPADDVIRSFDTLFATNHKFYGFMDLFLNLPVHTGGYGLMDIGGRIQFKPLKKVLYFVDLHYFRRPLAEPSTGYANLGLEVDSLLRYTVNQHLAIEGVVAFFMPKAGMSALKGGGTSTELYGYLQADFRL